MARRARVAAERHALPHPHPGPFLLQPGGAANSRVGRGGDYSLLCGLWRGGAGRGRLELRGSPPRCARAYLLSLRLLDRLCVLASRVPAPYHTATRGQPRNDFIMAAGKLAAAGGGGAVFVTARWLDTAALNGLGSPRSFPAGKPHQEQWVEQRALRFADVRKPNDFIAPLIARLPLDSTHDGLAYALQAADPPENLMLVGNPLYTAKAYLRLSFVALGLLVRRHVSTRRVMSLSSPHHPLPPMTVQRAGQDRPPQRLLLIGLGAGHLVGLWSAYLAPGGTLGGANTPAGLACGVVAIREIDCVELHPEVVVLARRYFGFGGHAGAGAAPRVTVTVADGREVLKNAADGVYDLVVVDLDRGGLVDTAACADLRRVLRPGGVW